MAEKLPSTGKYMDEQDKERVVVEVTHRVMDAYGRDPRKVEQALFDTLYDERLRLRTEKDKDEVKRLSGYYKKMQSEAARADGEHQRELLQELIGHYTTEVSGHFDKRVYKVATSLLPTVITGLLNTMSPMKLIQGLPRGFETLGDQLVIQGESELLLGGKTITFTDEIPKGSRKTYNMSDKVPSGRASVMVKSLDGARPIMVERSMYWNNRGAGTNTVGVYSN